MNNFLAVKRVIKQLLYVLSPSQKRGSFIVFLAMIMTSLLELLGVSSIYPLLKLMMNRDEIRGAWYVDWIYMIYPDASYSCILIIFCILIIIIFLLKNSLAVFFAYLQFRFAAKFQKEASTDMLKKYINRPYEFFLNTNSSIVMRGIGADTASVYQIILCLFQMIGEIVTIIAIAVFLISLDAKTALMALILAGLCFGFIVGVFKGKMKTAGKNAREAYANQAKYGYQIVNGIKEIMVLDRSKIFVTQYEQAAEQAGKSNIVNGVVSACPDRILEGVCLSGFVLIVCIRLVIDVDAQSFIPILGSFAMGAFKILPSVSKLSTRINQLVFHQFGLQNCYENYLESEENKSENYFVWNEEKQFAGILPSDDCKIVFSREIKIDNITWKYRNTIDNVIDGLTLSIKKGESVAFVGASGAGKTTLADIIMGLLKPQTGHVYMDGIDIFSNSREWHKQIGYVPQSIFLIDDSIRANVAFGLPTEMISDKKVWLALEQAQFKDFVEGLPDGLDTVVGERGIKFSGGQRQRIALARALYEEPEILVLDEATSALDNETEEAVMESIEQLQGHKTLIIIAHRLTTIKNCDKIYRIEAGKAEEVTYEDLTC